LKNYGGDGGEQEPAGEIQQTQHGSNPS